MAAASLYPLCCVYWLNPRNSTIYYLYSDEGLDIASDEKINLEHIYAKFNDWILSYPLSTAAVGYFIPWGELLTALGAEASWGADINP